ncbi:hypothetical protein HD806DRAFT_535425 [Xylariaceae sp. AK1471]|nr:hypothetical protein HD806DRAFT_535425 [Xylariaceae sp. AK1471]
MEKFKLVYTVPMLHLQTTKDSVSGSGAKYVQVAFELTGSGQCLPVSEKPEPTPTPAPLVSSSCYTDCIMLPRLGTTTRVL